MIIVGLAAIGATVVTALLAGLSWAFGRANWPAWSVVGRWAALLWAGNFVLDLLILYIGMPALTGPYGGWGWVLWPLALSAIYVIFGGSVARARESVASFNANVRTGQFGARGFGGFASQRRKSGGRIVPSDPPGGGVPAAWGGAAALGLVLLVAIAINGLIVVSTTWFDPNTTALAQIPNIQRVSSTTLPPTNVDHIVLVTQDVAAYLGQQALASGGQNLGSLYQTKSEEYTLQSVRGHLYWIAPLVYNNVWANIG